MAYTRIYANSFTNKKSEQLLHYSQFLANDALKNWAQISKQALRL